ncbi:hypothetical protein B1A99_11365 [Cohnella sp. CIP 111063]|uniref:hypothetical protein n=1 Tax=unclassified Cohnella TaxID=2636738 RepID=UPI000B8C386E|nr:MULTISPECIES: hypothetical protein [unclassified Cohnella]OXS59223.1 hypothetical protein B1A99_11365 [Cohnella sp. CIP 111063]PRX72236.1 hypothetical protein B0G52_106102 [Cohnella sp. SGD-V74]
MNKPLSGKNGSLKEMPVIRADRPFIEPPEWAILERRLMDVMNEAVDPLVERYIRPDGTIMWPTRDDHIGIDALDDMYESFFNWPLYYAIGGHEKFKDLSLKEFDAITRQFAKYDTGTGHKMIEKEYEQGYDWFHQGEGYTMFYHMALMDPQHAVTRERAVRFAGFFLNEDPDAVNFDEELAMIPYPHSGSKGATDRNIRRNSDGWYYQDWMKYYGLPFQDVPGVRSLEDIKHEAGALALGAAVAERMSKGDVPLNLLATSMVTNAYLHTGDPKYKAWVKRYVEAWMERTKQNGGVIPDNVGLSGVIGEHNGGKWYGGWYGWTWPHGWVSIGQGVAAAGENAMLLMSDSGYLEFLRSQLETLESRSVEHEGTKFVPYKYGDPGWYGYEMQGDNVLFEGGETSVAFQKENPPVLWKDGWFEFQPMDPVYPTHLWYMSMRPDDLERLNRLRNYRNPDWNDIRYVRAKDQAGHDYAWVSYLQGEYPSYPVEILKYNLAQAYQRLDFMNTDTEDPAGYKDDYIQIRNPVTLEGLLQLTMGAPSPLYNGGLLMAMLRYYDADAQRPGLPPDVAALVEKLDEGGVAVKLVNLHPTRSRRAIVQAGAFGEHRFTGVKYEARGASAGEGGKVGGSTTMEKMPSGISAPSAEYREEELNGKWLLVELGAGCHTTLELGISRFANDPSYEEPWK